MLSKFKFEKAIYQVEAGLKRSYSVHTLLQKMIALFGITRSRLTGTGDRCRRILTTGRLSVKNNCAQTCRPRPHYRRREVPRHQNVRGHMTPVTREHVQRSRGHASAVRADAPYAIARKRGGSLVLPLEPFDDRTQRALYDATYRCVRNTRWVVLA